MATRDATLARILRQQGFALVDAFSARLGESLRRLVSAWPLTRANRAGLMRQIDGVFDWAMGLTKQTRSTAKGTYDQREGPPTRTRGLCLQLQPFGLRGIRRYQGASGPLLVH